MMTLHTYFKKPAIFLILAWTIMSGIHSHVQAQNVTGFVVDSVGKPLESATVSLISLRDSSLFNFYLTDEGGDYLFKNVPVGKYRVHISRIGYFQRAVNIELTAEQPSASVDTIQMSNSEVELGTVDIVEEAPPVTLRGDTLEFNAGSFRTAPNGMVEDLLKKLPGVEIQSDGSIKVNGQTVNRVMVDGKEFFSSDPRVATRNLQAEAIDKVQVFDQKSDAEQITGMDDGNQEMSINLTLKDSHKTGTFGNISGGYGTNDRWYGKANVNLFNKTTQYSLIANGNNINEPAFSFMEIMEFTGGFRDMMESGGGMRGMRNQGSDGIGFPIESLVNSQSQGVNTQASGGLRASRDWKEKVSLTGNYFYTLYKPNLVSNTSREYFLPDSTYYYYENQDQQMLTMNHRLEADFRWTPKKTTKLRFRPVVSYYNLYSDISKLTATNDAEFANGNSADNQSKTTTDAFIYSSDLRFAHGFRRKGRSISAEWKANYRPSATQQDLNNSVSFFQSDTTFAGPQTIQRWNTANATHNETFKIAYTEPVAYRWLGEISLAGGLTSAENIRDVFGYNTLTGLYENYIGMLSNEFHSDFMYGNGGLKFRRNGKKLSFSFGAAWQQAILNGSIPNAGFEVRREFAQLLPNAQVDYNISRFRTISLNYRSSLKPPGVTQLQPIQDFSNPLMIQSGNPDLGAQTDHDVRMNIRFMDPGRGRFAMLWLNGSLSQDAIGTAQQIDENGISTYMPINVQGNWNSNGRLTLQTDLKKIKSSVSIEPGISLSRTANEVNGEVNPALTVSYTPRLRYTFAPTDSFELQLRGDWTRSTSTYANGDQTEVNTYNFGAELLWMLPKGFTLTSSFSYAIFDGTSSSTSVPLWKAALAKSFLKSGRGELKLSTFDVLKLNTGVSNSATTTYTEQVLFNTLSRYYMVTLSYRLSPYKQEKMNSRGMMRMYMGG